MDLFDGLDTEPAARKTFTVEVDISAPFTADNSPDALAQDTTLTTSPLNDGKPVTGEAQTRSAMDTNTTFAQESMSNEPSTSGAPKVKLLESLLSAVSRVKNRLEGKEGDMKDTQPIYTRPEDDQENNTSTQRIEYRDDSPDTQALSEDLHSGEGSTQAIGDDVMTEITPDKTQEPETQPIGNPAASNTENDSELDDEDVVSTRRTKKSSLFVSGEEEDDDDEKKTPPPDYDSDTQQVSTQDPNPLHKLFVSDSESDTEQVSVRTQAEEKEERLRKIKARAHQKKTERLLKQQKEKDKNSKDLDNDFKSKQQKKPANLKNDIANDDDDGYYDDDDDDVLRSEDEREQENKNVTFDIEVNTVKTFAKSDLFAAFAKKKSTTPRTVTSTIKTPATDTPETTPSAAQVELDDSDSSSDENLDVMDLVKNGVKMFKPAKLQPPLALKVPSDSSKIQETIELDDSDSDIDIDVPLSKAKVLDIKSKFSKKNMEIKKAKHKSTTITKNYVFSMLRAASKKQITADLKERQGSAPEMSKDEIDEVLDVESLLLRHMKHASMVKEQEEKSSGVASGYVDSEDDVNYSAVPDSDVAESDDDQEDDDEDEDGEAEDLITSSQMPKNSGNSEDDESKLTTKSRRKNVIDDEEDDDNDTKENIEVVAPKEKINIKDVLGNANKDDSINIGFFGGNFSQGQTQQLKNDLGISMTQLFDKGSPKAKVYGSKVFEELRERNGAILGDIDLSNVNDSMKQDDSFYNLESNQATGPIDYDEPATQLADLEPPSLNPSMSIPATVPSQTQADIATMRDTVTQADYQPQDTQDDTKVIDAGDDDEDDNDDDEDVVEKPRHRRRLMKKGDLSDIDSGSENDDEEETKAEKDERLRMAEIFKEQRRRDQLDERRRKKEMKARGVDVMMENEADESEDEWAGVGGADGEREFEMDSEDEKMFDDITKVKQNRLDLAKKLHDESAETDQKMLMKILKDLETGNWKRRGNNDEDGLNYDDEEDELIRRYRLYKQQKKRQMVEEDANLRQLAKDKKSQAFFQSITEDSQNDAKNDIFAGQESHDDSESGDDEDDPFVDKSAKDKLKSPEDVSKKSKNRTITQAYVQKSLSFLNDMEDDAPEVFGGYLDEDDLSEDLHTLKQNSIINMADKTPQRKKTIVIDDQNSSPSDLFKMPSMKRSFQSLGMTTTVRNTDVTISTSAKTVSGSGSSIMSLGRGKSASKIDIKTQRVLKAQKVKKQVKINGGGVLKRLASMDSSAFE